MASISNSQVERESGGDSPYGSSYGTMPGRITSQDREAAEVLLQIGLLGTTRNTIIRETRSELTLKPAAQPSSVIVSSISSKVAGEDGGLSVRSRGNPGAIVKCQLGGSPMIQAQGGSNNMAVITHCPPLMTPQRVPISVVKRKDIEVKNRRTSPPLNHIKVIQPPAITIRPTVMKGNTWDSSGLGVRSGSGIYSVSSVKKVVGEGVIPTGSQLGLWGGARVEMVIRNEAPVLSTSSANAGLLIEKVGSGSDRKIIVDSIPQRKPVLEPVVNNQKSCSNLIPISIDVRSDGQNPCGPKWIGSKYKNVSGIRLVSPVQLSNAAGDVGSIGGNILLPRATLIHVATNNNYNYNNNKELSSSYCSENAEQQRIKQNKLMKKALRARAPMSRNASEPIAVDEFNIPKEFWAKAFVQSDICHAAGILFKALFTPDEIQNCTLRGRNGTFLLDLKKRSAIFRAVGWMKNKNQNPYSFDSNCLRDSDLLTQDEKMIIEKKVFVERRYQTSRKIRDDVPSKKRDYKSQSHKFHIYDGTRHSLPLNSSDEASPPLEVIVKSEPRDIVETHISNYENDVTKTIIKCEREEEPMDTEEDATPTPRPSDGQPSSPKQINRIVF